jgi:putative ABC transport system permease protein
LDKKLIMFKNSWKIAWRHLVKDGRFTLLNLAGLSIGLTAVFLIFLWINHETSMDNFQDGGLYLVMQNVPSADKTLLTFDDTPDLLGNALKTEVPGIADAATVKLPSDDEETAIISDGKQNSFKATEAFASSNFFKLFKFKLLQGDAVRALSGSKDVLLSDRLAEKLFHSAGNAMGKTVTFYKGLNEKINGPYLVSGIFAAPPANSSLQFDLLFPNQVYMNTTTQYINWNSSAPGTYVTLKNGVSAEEINRMITDFLRKKTGDKVWTGKLFIQRFKDKYLHNHFENGVQAGGRIAYVRLFSIVAIFLIAIACINFTNLATARASIRLKEVGIKKVVGAGRGVLILQYMGESVLMAMLSMIIAGLLVMLLISFFEQLTGAQLFADINFKLVGFMLLITLFTGLLAGSYPALYLSGFKPALILKGNFNLRMGGQAIRKGLVVFQFCISAVLIISVMVIYRQMQFIQTRNLGYNKSDVIAFANAGSIQQNTPAFLTDLKKIPGVVNASDMEGDLFGDHSSGGGIDWPGKVASFEFSGIYADFNFPETIGLQMTAGRTFSSANPADSNAVIFNETAIRRMGLRDPLGKTVKLWGSPKTIVGVVKDFNYESLYNPIGPLFINYRKTCQNIIIRINPAAEKTTLAGIANLYHAYNRGLPFEYKFFDEDYHKLYASEERVATLSKWFAGIAISISCLGLFGLSAFVVQRRRKEISIRKVVGASLSQLATILSVDFVKLVLIAFLIAAPLSWLALRQWLQTFAYHVSMNILNVIIPGVVILIITIVTVSFQTVKGALANPVTGLRNE